MRVTGGRIARGAALCAGLTAGAGFNGAEAQEALIFGVRADAPPFSHHATPPEGIAEVSIPGTPRDHGFEGYIVELCNAVLDSLLDEGHLRDVDVHTRMVNAGNRFELLRSGAVHILCDPATIAPDRLKIKPEGASETLRRLNVSVPVYMSAVTFASPSQLPGGSAPCRILVGAVGETTAVPRGIDSILADKSFGRWSSEIEKAVGLLREGALPQIVAGREGDATCPASPAFRSYSTHDEIAQAFCDQQVLYYVGDIEIIRSMLVAKACLERSVIAPATFTDERYGIYTALPGNGAVALAILNFLAELSLQVHEARAGPDGGGRTLLDSAYHKSLAAFQPSHKLRAFYWSITGSFPTLP